VSLNSRYPIMRRYRFLGLVAMAWSAASLAVGCERQPGTSAHSAELPDMEPVAHTFQLSGGSLDFYVDFPSAQIADRNISVWLPEGYDGSTPHKVLYMHDGQMLFDSTATWNKQEWAVDETAQRLIDTDRVHPFIVVGIWNRPEARVSEYFPQKAYEILPEAFVQTTTEQRRAQSRFLYPIRSDDYLRFIVSEVRPFIEERYEVSAGPENTFIAGSSMGGLISMYALCEYPSVFGGGACLSTHWPGMYSNENNPIPDTFLEYLDSHLPDEESDSKWYFDHGDQTLDSLYGPHQKRVDSLFRAKGLGESNWRSDFYPGTNHSEDAWRARLHEPLIFLLGK